MNPSIVISENYKGRKNKGYQNKSHEEYWNDQEKETTAKVYDLNSDDKINGDFGTIDHENDINNDNKEHIPRAKVRPINNNNNNKPSPPTVKETSLKTTQDKETNKEDKDDTMGTSYNKEEDKYEGMTLDSKP